MASGPDTLLVRMGDPDMIVVEKRGLRARAAASMSTTRNTPESSAATMAGRLLAHAIPSTHAPSGRASSARGSLVSLHSPANVFIHLHENISPSACVKTPPASPSALSMPTKASHHHVSMC